MSAEFEVRTEGLTYVVVTRPDGGRTRVHGRAGRLLIAFLKRRELTFDQTIAVIYPNPDHEPGFALGVIRVIIGQLRRKLAGTGYALTTVRGEGYMLLPPDSREKVIQLRARG